MDQVTDERISIVALTSEMVPDLYALEVQAFGQVAATEHDTFLDLAERAFGEDGYYFFAVQSCNKPIGYLCFCETDDATINVSGIVLQPQYRGRRLGQRVFELCLSRVLSFKATYRRVTLEVRDDNTSAINLYSRLGFQRSSTIANYYSDGGSAIAMCRTIEAQGRLDGIM